ncbi:hypothetical protein Tco_0469145 [Tanacetum coccineum]
MSAKDSITTQACELSKEEFNDFLTLYPIPSEYPVILPKSNQTVYDAPLGSKKHVPNLLPKVITHIKGWHEQFFYVQDSIIPAKYTQLLSEQNKLESKSFKDKLPLDIEEKMAFRNFIYTGDDEDLSFLPKEPSLGFDIGSPSVSVNTEPLKAKEEPAIQPVEVTTDSGERPKPELPPVKRKLAPGFLTSRATRAKTSSSKDDAPYLTVSDDDEDLHDRCYARQAVVDNVVNRRSHELLQVIRKLRGEFDVMKDRERAKEEECNELLAKCEAAMTEFEKNPIVVALREKISTLSIEVKEHKVSLDRMMLESQKWAGYQESLSTLESKVTFLEAEKARLKAFKVSLQKEVEELKQDRREVVSKFVPYAAMELVHSDDMGSLVSKLVSSAILYGRCRAYEQVANMKEPFDLSKFVADPSAPIEALLSKKPPSLQRHVPSRTQVPFPSSQKATSSSFLVSNPMSPPADVSVMKPQSSQLQ